jgi:hypothetical protein
MNARENLIISARQLLANFEGFINETEQEVKYLREENDFLKQKNIELADVFEAAAKILTSR